MECLECLKKYAAQVQNILPPSTHERKLVKPYQRTSCVTEQVTCFAFSFLSSKIGIRMLISQRNLRIKQRKAECLACDWH